MSLGAKLGAALLFGPALNLFDGAVKTDGNAEMEDPTDGLTDDCPDTLGGSIGANIGCQLVGGEEIGRIVRARGASYKRKEENG